MVPDCWRSVAAPGYQGRVNVYKKPDGRWYFRKWVRCPDGKRRRVFGTPREFGLPNTKAATQEAMARKIAALLSGQAIVVATPSSGPTVSKFWEKFLEHSEAKNEASTVDSKKQIFRDHIEPTLGARPVRSINYATIEDLKHALLKPRGKLGAKTVNNVLTVLRRMLVVAKKRGVIDEVPEIEWLKADRPAFDFFAFDEAPRLAAAADGEWIAMILVGLRCGLRQSELIGLRWEDVDLVAGKIHVRQAIVRGKIKPPKNGKPREVPLSNEARAALKSHRHLRGEYVFCDLDGKPLTKGECKHPLWRACKRSGLRRVGWHVLRHTFASHLAMRGVPLRTIMELMGHSTIQMTMRYAHLSPEVSREAVNLLDAGDHPVTGGAGNGSTRGETG